MAYSASNLPLINSLSFSSRCTLWTLLPSNLHLILLPMMTAGAQRSSRVFSNTEVRVCDRGRVWVLLAVIHLESILRFIMKKTCDLVLRSSSEVRNFTTRAKILWQTQGTVTRVTFFDQRNYLWGLENGYFLLAGRKYFHFFYAI